MVKKRYYIAYGSNLNIGQMAVRCPIAKVIGTAVIDDYELLFKGSKTGSYLTIEPKTVSKVPAVVWEVTAEDERALDRYEGYPRFYYKKEMTVDVTVLRSGRTSKKKVFMYIMHEGRPLGIPSQYYVKVCLEGYREFDFDKELRFAAIKKGMKEEHKNEE